MAPIGNKLKPCRKAGKVSIHIHEQPPDLNLDDPEG